jgi:hypothetical protein
LFITNTYALLVSFTVGIEELWWCADVVHNCVGEKTFMLVSGPQGLHYFGVFSVKIVDLEL